MGRWGRIVLISAVFIVGGWADQPESSVACRSLNSKSSQQCDPYQMILIPAESTRIKPSPSTRTPITQKKLPKAIRYRKKRTIRLDTLLDKHVKKEEEQREEQEHLLHMQKLKNEQTQKIPAVKPKWLKVAKGEPLPSARASMQFFSDDLALIDDILGIPGGEKKPKAAAPKTIRPKPPTKAVKKPVAAAVEKKPTVKPAPKKKPAKKETGYYRVQKGDSLLWISKKFNVHFDELSLLNTLEGKRTIRIGQKLRIPMSQSEIDIITAGQYKVEVGDSLLGIAKRFHVSLANLMKLNKIEAANRICIGQKLILPLPHKLAEIKRKKEEAERKRLAAKRERERKYREAIINRERKKLVKRDRKRFKRSLWVQATAYTSHPGQTDKTPFLAAWNNRIRPGMKIIAVSHDLIRRYGITNGVRVKISGLKGIFTVRDKMNRKWRKKIDIYMGTNQRKALRWGRRRVILFY